MAVKIRLQRHGKKDAAFFHIVVADGRAPRDGKYIEKLGVYNPTTNPATINLDFDGALNWMLKGAQPTDTCRAILSYKGVIYKKHLLGGVTKGALTEAQVEQKFSKWLQEKESKVNTKKDSLVTASKKKAADKMSAETARKEAIAAKNAAKLVAKPAVEEKAAEAETPANNDEQA
jgi:small subunit ribosomal protein S16